MRRLLLVLVAVLLLNAGRSVAQEWSTYTNRLGFITLEGPAEKMFD
jgi:hypothetical protein